MSLVIGGSRIWYFTFLTKGTSDTPLILGLTYAGVQATVTYLRASIAGWSPLCRGDYCVEVPPENLTIFSEVFIIVAILPCLNL